MTMNVALDAERLGARLRHRAARDPQLRELRELAGVAQAELWLVGGYVRNAALGLRSDDIDLVAGRRCAELVAGIQARWRTAGYRFRKRGVTTKVSRMRPVRIGSVGAPMARDMARSAQSKTPSVRLTGLAA